MENVINGFDFEALPIRVTYIGERTTDDWKHDLWDVEIKWKDSIFRTEYKTGTGLRAVQPVTPKNSDIMFSLLSDAEACNMSFNDWCDNYGMNADSIKDLTTYQLCCSIGNRLINCFGREKLMAMREALVDY